MGRRRARKHEAPESLQFYRGRSGGMAAIIQCEYCGRKTELEVLADTKAEVREVFLTARLCEVSQGGCGMYFVPIRKLVSQEGLFDDGEASNDTRRT